MPTTGPYRCDFCSARFETPEAAEEHLIEYRASERQHHQHSTPLFSFSYPPSPDPDGEPSQPLGGGNHGNEGETHESRLHLVESYVTAQLEMCRNQSETKDAVASAAAAAEAAAADDGDDEEEDDDDDDDDDDWLNDDNDDSYVPRAPDLGPHYCPIEMCDRAMEPLPSRAALVMHFHQHVQCEEVCVYCHHVIRDVSTFIRHCRTHGHRCNAKATYANLTCESLRQLANRRLATTLGETRTNEEERMEEDEGEVGGNAVVGDTRDSSEYNYSFGTGSLTSDHGSPRNASGTYSLPPMSWGGFPDPERAHDGPPPYGPAFISRNNDDDNNYGVGEPSSFPAPYDDLAPLDAEEPPAYYPGSMSSLSLPHPIDPIFRTASSLDRDRFAHRRLSFF
ncbi:hypothetical protein N3K66_000865 [Trichothecium roseum]|uniref:Uncharacterized protein n=1 Tax=Trichothecium roseum TaxID=47278 RepID=A0ACC0VD35_9HYPO|nr:hypothetical protein N3K66_000865 [Trichothecium roseum]